MGLPQGKAETGTWFSKSGTLTFSPLCQDTAGVCSVVLEMAAANETKLRVGPEILVSLSLIQEQESFL